MHMPAIDGSFTISMTHPIGGQLVASLRERIIRGDLVPGMRLSEKDIAEAYGMSRQPVREAFIRLAGDGLVEVRPQRGTFVRKISTAEVEMSRFVREAVEADVAKLAATRASDADVAELRAQIERQAEVRDHDAITFMQLDERFHRTLAEIADRAGAWAHLQPIKMHMDRVRYLSVAQVPVSRLVAEHRPIVGAIADRDAEAAETAVRRHLRSVLEDLPRIVAAHPEFFKIGSDFPGPSTLSQGRTT